MKKIVVLVLALLIMLSGCGNAETVTDNSVNVSDNSQIQQDESILSDDLKEHIKSFLVMTDYDPKTASNQGDYYEVVLRDPDSVHSSKYCTVILTTADRTGSASLDFDLNTFDSLYSRFTEVGRREYTVPSSEKGVLIYDHFTALKVRLQYPLQDMLFDLSSDDEFLGELSSLVAIVLEEKNKEDIADLQSYVDEIEELSGSLSEEELKKAQDTVGTSIDDLKNKISVLQGDQSALNKLKEQILVDNKLLNSELEKAKMLQKDSDNLKKEILKLQGMDPGIVEKNRALEDERKKAEALKNETGNRDADGVIKAAITIEKGFKGGWYAVAEKLVEAGLINASEKTAFTEKVNELGLATKLQIRTVELSSDMTHEEMIKKLCNVK